MKHDLLLKGCIERGNSEITISESNFGNGKVTSILVG